MNHKPYNGYFNYETWSVALIIDNDQALQELVHSDARTYIDVFKDPYDFAISLKDLFEDQMTEIIDDARYPNTAWQKLLASQLLNAALAEVNWDELAKNYIDEVLEAA